MNLNKKESHIRAFECHVVY